MLLYTKYIKIIHIIYILLQDNKINSLQILKTECDAIKSKAVVKYSSVIRPANFAHLQCNTDLNLPPSNWLSSAAESYGLQHMFSHSDGFSR